jgi:hypothetical protein
VEGAASHDDDEAVMELNPIAVQLHLGGPDQVMKALG